MTFARTLLGDAPTHPCPLLAHEPPLKAYCHSPRSPYPPRALAARVSGDVPVEILFDEAARPQFAHVTGPAHRLLRRPAIELAQRQGCYVPPAPDGARCFRLQLDMKFRIEEQ